MSLKPNFISAGTVKKYGVVENNVDDKLISQVIAMTQDLKLQQILGSDLYEEIAAQIDGGTLTALNTTLLVDYIRDFLINSVASEGVYIFSYRYSNKGIITQSGESQNPVSQRELELLEQRFARLADFYARKLSLYLLEKSTDYPLFMNGNTEYQDQQSSISKYGTGIFLGNARRKNQRKKRWPYCD
jgi:hypothetical protein